MRKTFDFVVIGAGSAGCVVANRLTTAGHASVCVLEAGPADTHPFIHIPAGFMKTVVNRKVNWLYETEPGEWTAGRRVAQPRGKTLGGSGSINGHIYNRGQRMDFDVWAQRGNRGWSYAEILPYFKRTERRIGEGDDRFRGREGNFTITDLDWTHPLVDAFVKGAIGLGMPMNPDYNGVSQRGVAFAQRSIENGRRVSPARAFLHPARTSGRLEVYTEALVDIVIFEGKRAVGVQYLRGGRRLEVRARREVIVCGGTFNSPQVLQRSGVGPPGLLAELGIDVICALQGVGENLRDHCYVPITARVKGTDSLNERSRGLRLLGEIVKYALTRGGILSLQPTLVYLTWDSDESVTNNDIQLTFTPASYHERYEQGLAEYPGMTCGVWQHRPESKGYVRARSADPFQAPVIQPNYLDEEIDRKTMLGAARLARRLLATPEMAPYYAGEQLPGEQVDSDDEWLDYAKRACSTCYHPMGSCRMGPASDVTAVVDDQLRVYGVGGLRVVDASIMPTMPSANTNASTLMVAEKASDMILGRPAPPPVELQASADPGSSASMTDAHRLP